MHVIDGPSPSAPPPYTESQSNILNSAPPPYTPSDVSIIPIETPSASIPQSIIILEAENDKAYSNTRVRIIWYVLIITLKLTILIISLVYVISYFL